MRLGGGGGDGEFALFDPLGGDEVIGQAMDGICRAAYGKDFHAVMVVEVDVQGGDDEVAVIVLDLGKQALDLALVVIEDQRDGAGDFMVSGMAEVIDQIDAHHLRHGL